MVRRAGTKETFDLKQLMGEPGYLLVSDLSAPDKERRLSCKVRSLSGPLLKIVLQEEAEQPQPGAHVVLEVATRRALVQCFTSVERTESPLTLSLRRPAQTHIVQRRRYPRVEVFVGATFRHGGNYGIVPAQLINLSVDGAAMVVVERLQPGSVLSLCLSGIGLDPDEVPARVVRCTPSPNHLWVVGLSFGRLPPEQEQYLEDYINSIELTSAPVPTPTP